MNPWKLSDRQEQIMDLMVECGCNKLIARRLDIPVRTLENHVARAIARMDVGNRMQAAIRWDRYRRSNAP